MGVERGQHPRTVLAEIGHSLTQIQATSVPRPNFDNSPLKAGRRSRVLGGVVF